MSAAVIAFPPSPPRQPPPPVPPFTVYTSGPLAGRPVRTGHSPLAVVDPAVARANDEAVIATGLLARLFTAPVADRLEVSPAAIGPTGSRLRPVILIDTAGTATVVTADAGRRIAVLVQAGGREGAAHDLLGACDRAEALTACIIVGGV